MRALCVFCGARPGTDPHFREVARQFGQLLAAREWRLVYGGGAVGLMGVIADAVLQAGGKVTGVIPTFLASKEVLHPELDEKIVVDDLFERKSRMFAASDAFVALPGGMGTLDELLEVLTWRQLHQINKPLGILNTLNYFDALFSVFDHAAAAGFYDRKYFSSVIVDNDPEVLLTTIGAQV